MTSVSPRDLRVHLVYCIIQICKLNLYPKDLCEAKKVTNCIEQIKGGAVAQCGFLLHYILIRIIHF